MAYAQKKDWDKAQKFFDRALEITDDLDSKYHIGQIRYDIGKMMQVKGEKPNAKENFLEAQKIFKEIGAQRLLDDVSKSLENL